MLSAPSEPNGSRYQGSKDSCLRELISDLKAVCPPGLDRTFKALEAEVERVTTEIAVLKYVESLPTIANDWKQYGLSAIQASILEAIRRKGKSGITHEALVSAVYAHKNVNDWPEPNAMKVHVCHIRKILEKRNAPYWVETIWGQGYVMHDGYPPKGLPVTTDGQTLYRSEGRRLKDVR